MARHFYFSLLITLLTLVPFSYQVDPTYTECKPHIDARILDLAAKAIHAGVQDQNLNPCPPVSKTESAKKHSNKKDEATPAQQAPHVASYTPAPPPVYEAPTSPSAPEPVQYAPPPPPPVQYVPPQPAQPAYPTQPTPQAVEKMGIFDKFIRIVFGHEPGPRDPKYSQPWQTFPEFRKKKVEPGVEKTNKVNTEPGFISSIINKFVVKVFNAPDVPRDPKWATPWQTHAEHIKKKEEGKPKPKEPARTFIHLPIINKFVALIFGKEADNYVRDPKWATPWNTHPEHKRSPKEVTEKPKVVVVHDRGGLINSFVSLFFEVPKDFERDIKWSTPWQTHPEHKKAATSKDIPQETKKVSTEPGIFSKSVNKFVSLIFGESTTTRDPKFATPWQTHPEHAKKKVEGGEKSVEKKVEPRTFFGLRTLINKFVEIIFGKSTDERDPKWAQPWQTHPKPVGIKLSSPTSPPPSHKPAQSATSAPPPPVAAPAPPTPPPVVQTPPPPPVAAPAPPPPVAAPAPSPPVAAPALLPPPVAAPAPPPPPKAAPPPPPPTPPKEEKVSPPKEKEVESFPSDSKAGIPEKAPSTPDRVVSAPKAPVKQVLEELAPEKEPKKEKIIEDEEQIVVVPSAFRPRDHIDAILGLDEAAKLTSARTNPIADSTLRDLKKICETAVKPLETTYKYQDISNRHLSDAELFGTPLVLMLGPYSTGKSTFINYLLGTEFTKRALKTGTPPSHGVFRIVKHGEVDRELDGTDLSGHWTFGFLQKFGQNFVDQLRGKEINNPLLRKVTFVEAPGILEMRRPGERLYPFNDVVQWFIDRADLILIMFDYTKLDAGYEMEAVLDQLKGREAQTRILLNKADQVPPEELIKVQGSLFWNLSPLLGASAPPTVYAGSFTTLPYRPSSPVKLFQAQEEALLHDIAKSITSRVDNRIAIARRHAVRVRNHAQMVDTYLTTFYRNKGFLTSKHKLAEEITENPHAYNIYEGVSLMTNVSRYDLPDAEVYRDFFRIHNLYGFKSLKETCTFLSGCPIEKLDAAINKQLPELMDKYRRLVEAAAPGAKLPDANFRPGGAGAHGAHAHHSKS